MPINSLMRALFSPAYFITYLHLSFLIMTSQNGSIGQAQLRDLKRFAEIKGFADTLKEVSDVAKYCFFHITDDRAVAGEHILYSRTDQGDIWTTLGVIKCKGQKILYPRFFQGTPGAKQKDWQTTSSMLVDAESREVVLEAATESPFGAFSAYADSPGLVKDIPEREPRTKIAYRLLCSFIQYLFLLRGQTNQVFVLGDGQEVVELQSMNNYNHVCIALSDFSKCLCVLH